MAVVHRTTMQPTKLEFLAEWLPLQPWYLGQGQPELARAGGFRLDDPEGEVGIEFMVVTDVSGGEPVAYHVPMSYRGAPLEGGEAALISTSEHGVLGTRWIYDGTQDPVLLAQLIALLQGQAVPQMQSESNATDPSVQVRAAGGPVSPRFRRVLSEAAETHADGAQENGAHVSAEWIAPDGARSRVVFVTA